MQLIYYLVFGSFGLLLRPLSVNTEIFMCPTDEEAADSQDQAIYNEMMDDNPLSLGTSVTTSLNSSTIKLEDVHESQEAYDGSEPEEQEDEDDEPEPFQGHDQGSQEEIRGSQKIRRRREIQNVTTFLTNVSKFSTIQLKNMSELCQNVKYRTIRLEMNNENTTGTERIRGRNDNETEIIFQVSISDLNATLHFNNESINFQENVKNSDYCLIMSSGVRLTSSIKICERPRNYIQKCCPENQVLNMKNPKECIRISEKSKWRPIFYSGNRKLSVHPRPPLVLSSPSNNETEGEEQEGGKKPLTEIKYGRLSCDGTSYIINPFLDKKFPNLQENGTLHLLNARKHSTLGPGEFCIDGLYNSDDEEPLGALGVGIDALNSTMDIYLPSYSGAEWNQGIIVCSPDNGTPTWINPLYAAVNHTAALFLLLTCIVYVLLWSHQNVHGWLQFSYALSLFFAFSFLAIVQVWSQQINEYSKHVCKYLGWLIHLTFLSAFFWLTSMNFDLWWRFSSGRRSLRRIRSKPCRENIKRFLLFSLFSLGFPFLISGSALTLDNYFENHGMSADLLPKFGDKKCYFHDKTSQFPFLYAPLGLLLLINLLFFTSTVLQLRRIHSNTELARSQSTLEDKKGVRLIAKLFIVMGVLWIFEFISWAANMFFPESESLLIWLFMPTDILNSLQGVAIFIIFICKPNVLSQLSAKFRSLRCK